MKVATFVIASCCLVATVSAQPLSQHANQIELGRYLFHDVRLSQKGNRSCALCHNPDIHWTNAFQKVPDIEGKITQLNTPSLLNVALNQSHTISTYGVHSLELAVSRPLLSTMPLEMGMTATSVTERLEQASPLYAPLFGAAFGDDTISYERAVAALAAFVATIGSTQTAYHRYLGGDKNALSDEALDGLALFSSSALKCSSCHSGSLLNETASSKKVEYYNVGMYGIEQAGGEFYYPSIENGLRKNTQRLQDDGKYRTPSLINVTNTGPWGHDGSYGNLSDVIDAYARGGRLTVLGPQSGDGSKSYAKHPSIAGFSITEKEKRSLLAFLAALSIENFDQLKQQTQSPFCQLVPLKNRTELEGCLDPFRVD